MYYMVVHLREEKNLEDVMLALTQAGIFNSWVMEGVSMENFLNRVPIFSGMRFANPTGENYVRIVCAVIEDKESVDVFLEGLSASGIDFERDNLGSIILMPIERAIISEPDIEI